MAQRKHRHGPKQVYTDLLCVVCRSASAWFGAHQQKHERSWCHMTPGGKWRPPLPGCLLLQWRSPHGAQCRCELQPENSVSSTTSISFRQWARRQRRCHQLTLRAALMSGLSSDPIANVWMGYCSFFSLASFTRVAATKLESRPPVKQRWRWTTNKKTNSNNSN